MSKALCTLIITGVFLSLPVLSQGKVIYPVPDIFPEKNEIYKKTMLYRYFELEKNFGFGKDSAKVEKNIFAFLSSAEKIPSFDPENYAQALRTLLAIEDAIAGQGFQGCKNMDLISCAFEEHKVDCDTKSLLYISLAEMIGAPIHAVIAPRHMLVVWKASEFEIFWETRSAEPLKTVNKQRIIEWKNIHPQSMAKGVYLRALAFDELLSFCLSNIGAAKLKLEDYGSAEKAYSLSLALWRENVNAIGGFGALYCALKNSGQAVKYLKQALEYDLNSPMFNYQIACQLKRQGYFEQAIEHIDRAIKFEEPELRAYLLIEKDELNSILHGKSGTGKEQNQAVQDKIVFRKKGIE